MGRALTFTDTVGFLVLGFAAYKIVELGPHDAAVLFGRCIHAFTVAAVGYL